MPRQRGDNEQPQEASGLPKCCLCREPVEHSGWCRNCNTWPINITPRRWCELGHPVGVDGICRECGKGILHELLPEKGEWRDTGRVPNLLGKQQVATLVSEIIDKLDNAKSFSVREDFASPWLKRHGIVIGTTPMGYKILSPPGSRSQVKESLPECFPHHVERLQAGGLSHAAAEMQAFSLVHEPMHMQNCSVNGVPF